MIHTLQLFAYDSDYTAVWLWYRLYSCLTMIQIIQLF